MLLPPSKIFFTSMDMGTMKLILSINGIFMYLYICDVPIES